MSQDTVDDDYFEYAKYTMLSILYVVYERIRNLRHIWRRQRKDVLVEIRYYVNGLFQGYYKVRISLALYYERAV